MIKYTFKRLLREPVPRLAVILFTGIMALLLCILQISMEREEKNRAYIYETVPVPVYITNLTGTQKDNLGISQGAAYVFENRLDEYIGQISLKTRASATWMEMDGIILPPQELVGISNLAAAQELSQLGEDAVVWLNGYDETSLRQADLVCILPQNMLPEDGNIPEIVLFHFETTIYNPEKKQYEPVSFDLEFSVAGFHTNNSRIYLPVDKAVSINQRLSMPVTYDSVGGILIDNYSINALRETASEWFAEPQLTNDTTSERYSYALKIDDSQLRAADEAMERSYTINRICTAVVFALSASAGFVIGFLMVRSRKKEIALMRTMGTPNRSIYFGFTLEQMLCVVLGIVLGGAYNQWQPMNRLGILAVIYFVGLALTLLIFLRKNLLTTIKEDE